MKLLFSEVAWREYLYWQTQDRGGLAKLHVLLEECRRTPFGGIGKPEPLKGEFAGWWSRRITQSDRLVYRVRGAGDDQVLEIAQCRYHYSR